MKKLYPGYFFALALAALAGCATASGTAGNTRSGSIITADEITSTHETYVYDVIARVRPNFLRSRGATSVNATATSTLPTVYMDGQRYGDITSLRGVLASQVREIHYYDSASGSARFGMQNTGGVIDLLTK